MTAKTWDPSISDSWPGCWPHRTFLVVEVAGGLWTGSLALITDAGHMVTDVGAIALSFLAVRFAQRPASPLHTDGFLCATGDGGGDPG